MSWVPFYREVVQVLSTYEYRQNELLELLREMQAAGYNTISLEDQSADGEAVPLAEIDPFTFLGNFHFTGIPKRIEMWKFLRQKWSIAEAVPDSFDGVPVLNPQSVWFFRYDHTRQPEDIPTLWEIFQIARTNTEIPADLFCRALQINNIGVGKLTIGLFWINPEKYLTLDGTMLKYLARYGIKPNISVIATSVDAYTGVLAQVHEALGYDHRHLSSEAWETRDAISGIKRYWAGGHDFGNDYGGPQKERFLRDGIWQANFLDSDQKPLTNRMRALFKEIQIGDEFAIKGCGADNLQVHAIGRVTEITPEEYLLKLEFLERPLYRGKRPVGAGAGNWTQTLLEIKRAEDIELIFHNRKIGPPPPPLSPSPLNQILYGPPGTGKTFASVARAVKIIDGVIGDDRAETVARFEELRAAGRIGFVTFHQSFAYEEFIEGLRPVLDDKGDGTARYEISDGVFKEMARRAENVSDPRACRFESLYEELLQQIEDQPEKEFDDPNDPWKWRLSFRHPGTIIGYQINGKSDGRRFCGKSKLREIYTKFFDRQSLTSREVHQVIGASHTNLIAAVFTAMKNLENFPIQPSDEVADIKVNESSRFVLIIDEINRGNIARIFGELITLLESDKRLGEENELRLKLPYSRETFGVPSNLYLLGTMNTADKSLALLDIALRRRFEFEELRPDFSKKLCDKLDDTMRGVLLELNARLMRVLDREHRLGHAAWMRVSTPAEWNAVFLKQIVPLLQEYFYNDWENLRAVLGEKGAGVIVRQLPEIGDIQSRTLHGWWFDCDENSATPDFLQTLATNFGLIALPQEAETATQANVAE